MISKTIVIVGLMASLLASTTVFAAPKPEAARSFVTAEVAKTLAVLGDQSLNAKAREQKFREMLLASFDIQRIGRYVCGAYWDRATDDQKTRFYAGLKSALVKTYLSILDDYSGEKVEIIETVERGDIALVTTSVSGGGSQDTHSFDWEVLDVSSELKLFDIIIDGVSTTDTMRQDYTSVLKRAGGNLDSLIAKLPAQQQ